MLQQGIDIPLLALKSFEALCHAADMSTPQDYRRPGVEGSLEQAARCALGQWLHDAAKHGIVARWQ